MIPSCDVAVTVLSPTLPIIIDDTCAVVDESSPDAVGIAYISNCPSTTAACTPAIPAELIADAVSVTDCPVATRLPLISNVPSASVGLVAVPLIVGCELAHDASFTAESADPTCTQAFDLFL